MPEYVLQESIEDFLASKDNPNTAAHYRVTLARFANWIGSKRPLAEITPLDVERYFNSEIKPHGYAPSTWNNHVRGIKIFFQWFVDLKAISESPAKHLKRKNDKRLLKREDGLTDEEFERLLKLARSRDALRGNTLPRATAFVLFCVDSAVRPGEAASLRLDEMDLVSRQATVYGKTGKRSVWFGTECAKELLHWLDWKRANYEQVGEFVWSKDGSPMLSSSISQAFRRLCKSAGLRSMGVYYSRHKKAFDCLDDPEINDSVSAAVMGHDLQTFYDYYVSPDQKEARDAARRLAYKPKIKKFTPLDEEIS